MAIYKTKDNAKDLKLVTNWYKNSYKECSLAVKKVCKNYGYELVHEEETFGELIFKRPRDVLDVQIVSLNMRETAIDFIIQTHNIFDFGRSKTVIEDLYERLKGELRFFKK